MPAWIHGRAKHLLAKNPDMPKSMAFGIATEQSHALGKTPKGYGTASGRKAARSKYDAPKKEYVKTPNPGDLKTPELSDKPKTRWTGKKLVKASAMRVRLSDIFKTGEDLIQGGKASGKPDSKYPEDQLRKGVKVELEHTGNKRMAREISKDHLEEFPDYYTRLDKMEREAEKAKERTKKASPLYPAYCAWMRKHADEDEGGGGRSPNPSDRAAIAKYLSKRPKGEEDEEFHEFLEGRGVNVPKGEAAVYDMASSAAKKTSSVNEPSLKAQIGKPKLRLQEAGPPDSRFAVKQGWQTSQYSGPLSMGRFSYRNPLAMPGPTTVPAPAPFSVSGKHAGPPPEGSRKKVSLSKHAAAAIEFLGKLGTTPLTPAGRLASSQMMGKPKTTAPPGPSIAQLSKPVGFGKAMPGAKKMAEQQALLKTALLEQMVRLGLKDVPKTPRLLMKHRTPVERTAAGKAVRKAYESKYMNPAMERAEKHVLSKLPEGKVRNVARAGTKLVVRDPVGQALANLVPVPGASAAYEVGKSGLRRAIDKIDPPALAARA